MMGMPLLSLPLLLLLDAAASAGAATGTAAVNSGSTLLLLHAAASADAATGATATNSSSSSTLLLPLPPPPPPPPDPFRPAFHFTPPQGWMNDPSKPIEDLRPNALHRFHLFFQWTPNSTKASWEGGWGPFWGHAVAQSIAGPWSMLCVAGAQAPDCAVNIGRQGTGGAVQLNATHFALTWPGGAAVSDDPALHLWVVYKQTLPPATGFLFVGNNNAVWKTSAGGLEMAVSGCTGTVGDRHGDPTLFRYSVATIDATDAWSYVAPIWVGHGLRQGRAECGDYFPLGNRTVAMYSHSGAVVVWMVGDELANGTFVPTATGQADYGVYYASASFEVTTPPSPATAAAVGSTASNRQNEGRRVMWAWVTEERNPPFGGSVWAGVQALPREVTLATDGSGGLSFSPARELQAWRSSTFHHPSVQIAAGGSNVELTDLAADGMQLELRVEIMLAPAPQPGGWNKTTIYYPGLLVRWVIFRPDS